MNLLSPANGLDLFFVLEGDADSIEKSLDNVVRNWPSMARCASPAVPRPPNIPGIFEVLGTPDVETLRGILEFVARNDSIRIVPLGASVEAALGDAADGSYGFFGDEAPAAAAAATMTRFGFFEPLPDALTAATAPQPAAEESYGFFEPLPDADDRLQLQIPPIPTMAPMVSSSMRKLCRRERDYGSRSVCRSCRAAG